MLDPLISKESIICWMSSTSFSTSVCPRLYAIMNTFEPLVKTTCVCSKTPLGTGIVILYLYPFRDPTDIGIYLLIETSSSDELSSRSFWAAFTNSLADIEKGSS